MTSPTAPPSDLPLDHPLPPSPSDSPQSIQILPIDTTPSPFNELEQLVTAYLIEHPPNANDNESADIGFLAWARYTLIDLISICKRSQLREANIRLYQGLPPAESVILEDHFVTLHDKI